MKKTLLIIITVAIAAGGYLFFTTYHLPPTTVKQIYYCPMHPQITSDKPGNCPICSMKLVKREGHPNEGHALSEHQG